MARPEYTSEGVAGGLVTARDPSLLEPGELSVAYETVYYPNDPSIHSAPGRTQYGTVNGAGQGLAYCAFNNADDILLSFSNHTLSYTPYTSTVPGGWSQFFGTIAGSSLDTVSVGHDHYIYTGSNPLHVYRLPDTSLALTNMGLLPVTKHPTVTLVAGTWSTEASMGNGWYWFLSTENFNDLESTFTGTPVACEMTDAAAYSFSVDFPGLRNGQSTHRTLYISDRQDNGTDPPPLTSFYAATASPIAVGQDTFVLGGTQTTVAEHYATAVDITFDGATGPWDGSPSKMLGSPNGEYSDQTMTSTYTTAALTFTFTTSDIPRGTTIVGMEVKVTAKSLRSEDSGNIHANGVARLQVAMGDATGAWRSNTRPNQLIIDDGVYTYGGAADNWTDDASSVSTLTSDDFINGTARVVLLPLAGFDTDFYQTLTSGASVAVDAVGITLTYGGTYVPTFGPAFPTVTQSVAGLDIDYPAYLPPPRGTTADVFENCLVQNDLSDPTAICWSLPGQYEYFPVTNRLQFQSKRRDAVTCIRRVAGTLLVGMQNQIKQLTSLQGNFDDLASDHGIVGPNAACLVDIPGRGPIMVYVAYNGLHATDGISTWTANEDLNWSSLVDINYLSQCRVVAYPTRYWIIVYYTPPGSTRNTKALVFSYHPSHDKNGKFACSGIVSVEGGGATVAYANGVPQLYTVGGDGVVWHEDDGTDNCLGQALVTTRLWYPWGIGQEGRVEKMFLAIGDSGPGGYLNVRTQGTVTKRIQAAMEMNSTDISTEATTNDGVNGGIRRVDIKNGACEGMFTTVSAVEGTMHLWGMTFQTVSAGSQDTRS